MKKWIAAVAVFVFGATLAFADHGGEHGRHERGMMSFVAMFGDKLALTDAQKQQIEAIQAKTRQDNAAFFESSRELMEQARAAREANDNAKLESLKPALQANREQMMKIRQAEMTQILPLLTAEQRAQLDKLRSERKHDH